MRFLAAATILAALGGCAGPTLGPSGGHLESTAQRQVACSAKGLRPGTDAFAACLGDAAAGTSSPEPKSGAAPTKPANCRLSPLGGYIC
jgi:hypothetical protein